MKKVLVCPLDWGLGHATRCIPVIREFQRWGCEISIASSGNAFQLLRNEFPTLTFYELPSYRPEYSHKNAMLLKMMAQLPKFARVINQEHKVTEEIVRKHSIDVVVSDNRYGCWSLAAKSIFITHQVRVLLPSGFAWASPFINSLLQGYIKKYNEVWIPDTPGSGLTGPIIPGNSLNQKYIGWLSRFGARREIEEKYEIIALVSGPEPQRTIFENLLTSQLTASGRKSLLVAGEPGKYFRRKAGCLEVVNHLSAKELEGALLSSGMVICRSGYSTVMDLIALGKKAVFVPTPRQPEQIFLADYFKAKQIAYGVAQQHFLLNHALEESKQFKGMSGYKLETSYLQEAIESVMI